jgi:hypothetical protein
MHMQESVNEVLATLRAITPNLPIARVAYPGFHAQQSPVHSSPSMQSQGSAPTPTPGNSHSMHGAPGVPAASPYPQSHDSLASLLSTNHRTSSEGSYRAPTATVPPQGMHQMHLSPPNSGYPQGDAAASGSNNNMLPPISTFPQQQNASGRVRFDEQQQHQQQQQQFAHPHAPGVPSSLKRPGLTLSTSNSADSSEAEEDDNGELTGLGMAAPFQELRHFADVAVKQNKIVSTFKDLECVHDRWLRQGFHRKKSPTVSLQAGLGHLHHRIASRLAQPNEGRSSRLLRSRMVSFMMLYIMPKLTRYQSFRKVLCLKTKLESSSACQLLTSLPFSTALTSFLSASTMDVRRFCQYLIRNTIRLKPCTNVLLSPWTVFVWLHQPCVTKEVSAPQPCMVNSSDAFPC